VPNKSTLVNATIGNSVYSIGGNCFQDCRNLTFIDIPTSVTNFANDCLSYTGLNYINIPSSISLLPNSCFRNCSNLSSVSIPISVTSLGVECFQACQNLPLITIPSSVISIGIGCFASCPNLITVTVDNANNCTTVSTNSFTNVSANTASVIGFYNVDGYSSLSLNWQTITTYYNTKVYYDSNQTPTVINVSTEFNKVYGVAPFSLGATTNNNQVPIFYTSLNTNVATVDASGIVTILAAGDAEIQLSQIATPDYTEGTASTNIHVEPSTNNNPTPLKNNEDIEYFLTTNAEYGEILSNIELINTFFTDSNLES
jgi:hypothetical protein